MTNEVKIYMICKILMELVDRTEDLPPVLHQIIKKDLTDMCDDIEVKDGDAVFISPKNWVAIQTEEMKNDK